MDIPHSVIGQVARLLLLVLGMGACLGAQAQTARNDGPLLSQPEGGATVTTLKAGEPVKMLKRQGFWVEVEAQGKRGWLKVSGVAFQKSTGPAAIDTGRLGKGNIVATSASRGLSAKDLQNGKPNFDEVTKLDQLADSASDVATFRSQGSLKPMQVTLSLSDPATSQPAAAIATPTFGQAAPVDSKIRKKTNDDW